MQAWVDISAIDELVDSALNAAIYHIQNQLNVETGDLAAMYFNGTAEWETMKNILRNYVFAEISCDKLLNEREANK